MDNNDFDLLETKIQKTGIKSPVDNMKVIDQMKSDLSSTEDPESKQQILSATLDSVMGMAENDKKDLLEHIKDLTSYQESVGLQFEGFTTLNDEENRVIEKAQSAVEASERNLVDSKIVPTGTVSKFWWKLTGGESKVDKAQIGLKAAKKQLVDSQSTAKQMFRNRIESAGMEELLSQYANKSRSTCAQLKEREVEIKQTEEELKLGIVEASKIHVEALKKKEETEIKLSEADSTLRQEQDKLSEISNTQSEGYATQLNIVTNKEQELEEIKGLQASYTVLAASKDSFMHKHNLTLKVLTVIRTDLQTQRTKLDSDTKERINYYQGYTTALKARTDQEFAAILEKLGVKTDETIAKTLASMYVASSKTRQEVMENIPEHERKMAETYQTVAESMAIVKERDAKIKAEFDANYGIEVEKLFEQYHSGDAPTGDSSADPVKKEEPTGDLLG